jgi:hypothetical protein
MMNAHHKWRDRIARNAVPALLGAAVVAVSIALILLADV